MSGFERSLIIVIFFLRRVVASALIVNLWAKVEALFMFIQIARWMFPETGEKASYIGGVQQRKCVGISKVNVLQPMNTHTLTKLNGKGVQSGKTTA